MATAPIARKDFWHFGGVSRIITVSYLRPIPKGITLLVKCKVIQIGKTNCEYIPLLPGLIYLGLCELTWQSGDTYEGIQQGK